MNESFSFDELIKYAAGEMDGATHAAVETYLCGAGARHASDVRRIRAAIQTMRRDDSREPRLEALARYRAIFQQPSATACENWIEGAIRVVANLLFDSRSAPALAGYRGSGQAVQLAFESSIADIELELEPIAKSDDARWHVTGQITVDGQPDVIRIACCEPGDETPHTTTTTDAHGGFSFEIERGAYDLFVRVDDKVIVVRDFRVE